MSCTGVVSTILSTCASNRGGTEDDMAPACATRTARASTFNPRHGQDSSTAKDAGGESTFGRASDEAAGESEGAGQHLKIFGTGYLDGAEAGQVRRGPLGVEQQELALAQPFHQGDQGDFGGVSDAVK